MAEIKDLSTTDANNTGTAANAGFPENMAYSDVNNAARALEGMIARHFADSNGTLTTTGSSNAYLLTPNRTVAAYTAGDAYMIKASFTNTGAVTINVSSLGAKSIVKPSGDALAAGEITSGGIYAIIYDGTNFQMAGADDPENLTLTSLTVTGTTALNGNTTIGDAATDTVTITADVASDLIPSADGTHDLGAVGSEWQDLFIDGTANIDSLVADTADIDAGTIDGTVIGGNSAAAITGTTVTANTSLNIAGDGATVTGIKDEDDMASDSATKLATQQSIKAYVDSQVTAQDLDFQADSGGALSVDLDSQTFTLTGGTGIDTSGSGQDVTFAIDSTVATTDGSQTLTNKTLTSPVLNTGVSGTAVLDEDNMASDSDTQLATQQSIKAYVDAQITAEDLDFQADSGGALSVDLDSQTFTLTGGTGIDTVGSGQTVTFNIDSTVATLTGSQALTNKTIDVDSNTVSNIEVDNLKSGVLDTDLTSVAATDTTLASAKAIKTYVDSQVTAQDLDVTDGSTSIDIDLDSESLGILGGTGIDSTASGTGVTLAIDSTVATLTGTQTLTNKTLTSPDINTPDIDGGTIDNTVIGGSTAAAGTFTTFTSNGIDDNASSTAVTIDSNNNLLVGKTTTALATAGLTIGAAGFASLTRNGAEPLSLNRLTDNGPLVVLYQGSGEVGRIGAVAGVSAYIHGGTGYSGVTFGNDEILPCDNTGATRDAAIDLGDSSGRFKDLHLSGGAYLGSTLEIQKTATGSGDGSNNSLALRFNSTTLYGQHYMDANGIYHILADASGAAGGNMQLDADATIRFATGSTPTERMRINSIGNVGIGVVPETHFSGVDALQIGLGASLLGNTTNPSRTYLNANSYFNSSNVESYVSTDEASQYFQNAGTHIFKVAPSGSADSAIGWTTAMTIVNSGRLGLGTSDPKSALEVKGTFGAPATSGSAAGFIQRFSQTSGVGSLDVGFGDPYSWLQSRASNNYATNFDLALQPNGGNVLVGKTAAGANTAGVELASVGIGVFTYAGRPLYLNRLTSDGDIIEFAKDGTTVGSIGCNAGSVAFGQVSTAIGAFNTDRILFPATATGQVQDNQIDLGYSTGRFDDIYATNGTIQTSDRNEKQDIEALTDAEQRVAVAAKGLLRKFRWKSSVEEKGDDARIHFGIIAQDLQDAFTAEGLDAGRYAMFISSTWTDEETGEERTRLGVRYSELLAFIISAI